MQTSIAGLGDRVSEEIVEASFDFLSISDRVGRSVMYVKFSAVFRPPDPPHPISQLADFLIVGRLWMKYFSESSSRTFITIGWMSLGLVSSEDCRSQRYLHAYWLHHGWSSRLSLQAR